MYGLKDVIEKLLMRGADVNATNNKGETALTVGNDSMAAFITGVFEKIEGEKKADEAGQQVGKEAINSEAKGSSNFSSRLTGRGVAVEVLLCVLVVLMLLYVRVHYWMPQPATSLVRI